MPVVLITRHADIGPAIGKWCLMGMTRSNCVHKPLRARGFLPRNQGSIPDLGILLRGVVDVGIEV